MNWRRVGSEIERLVMWIVIILGIVLVLSSLFHDESKDKKKKLPEYKKERIVQSDGE